MDYIKTKLPNMQLNIKRWLTKRNWLDILLFLSGTLISFKPPSDPDFGWHYKYGEYLWTTGQFLTKNIYSYTLPNYQWINSYWGFEALLYKISTYIGISGYTLITAALISAGLLVFLKIFKCGTSTKTSLFLSSILIMNIFAVTIRPHVYSSIFQLVLIWVLIKQPDSKQELNKGKIFKLLYLLPLLFLNWANIHAEYLIGLFVLGIFTVQKVLQKQSSLKHIGILIASTLVTIINPAGIQLLETLIKELTLPKNSFVAEWSHLVISAYPTEAGVFVAIISFLIFFLRFQHKKLPWWYKFLLGFFFIFALKATYFFRIFFIYSLVPFIYGIQGMDYRVKLNPRILKSIFYFLGMIFFLVSMQVFAEQYALAQNVEAWSIKAKYPYQAVEYLKQDKIEGNMYNQYEWGGYLIWLAPEYKPYIDGRMTQWKYPDGRYITKEYMLINTDPLKHMSLFEKIVRENNIKWIIYSTNSKLIEILKQKAGWTVVYSDEIATILRLK